jgi:hypothetical protein
MSDEPNNPAVSADESAPAPLVPPNHWRTRIRTISKLARKNLLAIIATVIAISGTSAYFAYQSKTMSIKNPDLQSRNDRPAIAIINADLEGFGEKKINLSIQFKNVEIKTVYSLAIIVVGFDPKTEKTRHLADIASTDPMRHDISFTQGAVIKRSEMLPVLVLCLLYADEDKQGFSEHLYYDAPDASKINGRIELRKLAPEPYKRVDDLKICRM